MINDEWREALDPNSKQIYYYNLKTKETTWTRPKEMGATMYNTGWFGRGITGKNMQHILDVQNAEWLKRPAIKQAENLAKREVAYREGSHEYNIWYNKFAGDQFNNEQSYEPAESRLNLKLQAGYTLADNIDGTNKGKNLKYNSNVENKYFCIWFARGKCAKGNACTHFHRLPTYADIGRLEKDMLHDVFGRERHAAQRDDMDGVGSFNDPSRTLYVGRLQRSKYLDKPSELREVVFRHFSEFGELENVNVVWRLSIAFVRYRFRTHSEFAKVAMAQQGLDHDEVLVLRWAYEDPNPIAKESMKRANADAVITAIKAAGGAVNQQQLTDKAEDEGKRKLIGPQLPATLPSKRLKNS